MPLPVPATERAPASSGQTGSAAILGCGSFLPDARVTNADLEQMVQTSDSWILERTGIRERRRAGAGITASTMAAAAGRAAMARAGVSSVDAIVVATSSPDTFIPPAACLVQRELGLPGVGAFDVNAACSGFVDAVIVGHGLVMSGAARTVLVAGAESLTRLVDYTDRATCVLFGDGAGAAVLGAVPTGGIVASCWGADGSQADLIYYGVPDGDPDGTEGLRMAGKGTFRLAVERMASICTDLCATARWRLEDVTCVVPHQANARIIEAVAKRTGVPIDRFVVNVDRLGNTGAASIALALAEAEVAGRFRDGDKVLLVAFGAGATWGGIAIEWTQTHRG
ncbi:MAG: ketoacyl-ACP synthase III [Candidatus Dormibacteraeota bacterium]|nr:ketoacyl-ACP synthase III [Candidatus Dormibacteraeota bacterium]